ncbi:MAG TPA: MGMT family protein, partial [Dongiaceae bacterium]|nr:MGMT family protein [Dongiaceae bacterium]
VGPQDVLIRVKAAGFNPTDYQLRQAGHPDLTPPIVLGRDVSGIVEACGQNPIAIVIPCHRIVGTNWLGGYSSELGLSAKEYLLDLERGQGRLF